MTLIDVQVPVIPYTAQGVIATTDDPPERRRFILSTFEDRRMTLLGAPYPLRTYMLEGLGDVIASKDNMLGIDEQALRDAQTIANQHAILKHLVEDSKKLVWGRDGKTPGQRRLLDYVERHVPQHPYLRNKDVPRMHRDANEDAVPYLVRPIRVSMSDVQTAVMRRLVRHLALTHSDAEVAAFVSELSKNQTILLGRDKIPYSSAMLRTTVAFYGVGKTDTMGTTRVLAIDYVNLETLLRMMRRPTVLDLNFLSWMEGRYTLEFDYTMEVLARPGPAKGGSSQ